MARTRAARSGPTTSTEIATSASSHMTLSTKTGPLPKLLILPKSASPEARIVALPNPRHGRPSRYLVCPESGVFEFIRVAAPPSDPRSWLIETHADDQLRTDVKAEVVMDTDLYIATEFDPLFLVLPALAGPESEKRSEVKKRLYLTTDDHLDKISEASSHLSEILCWPKTHALIESRMATICDSVNAGDEAMFRLSEEKLLTAILDKARNMSDGGLPPSMEDKFVKRPLEAPTLILGRKTNVPDSSTSNRRAEAQPKPPRNEPADSQASAVSPVTDSLSASPSDGTTSVACDEAHEAFANAMEAPIDIVNLQRLRVAFEFICSAYVSPSLGEHLLCLLKDSNYVDLSPLDDYLAKAAQLRVEAMATGAFPDFSRKRSLEEEENEARADRKIKADEEKRRKENESRGVRDLKKINTSGMKKMSDFFKAK